MPTVPETRYVVRDSLGGLFDWFAAEAEAKDCRDRCNRRYELGAAAPYAVVRQTRTVTPWEDDPAPPLNEVRYVVRDRNGVQQSVHATALTAAVQRDRYDQMWYQDAPHTVVAQTRQPAREATPWQDAT